MRCTQQCQRHTSCLSPSKLSSRRHELGWGDRRKKKCLYIAPSKLATGILTSVFKDQTVEEATGVDACTPCRVPRSAASLIHLFQFYAWNAYRQARAGECGDSRFQRAAAASSAILFRRLFDNFFARAMPPSFPSADACLFIASSIAITFPFGSTFPQHRYFPDALAFG